MMKCIKRFQSVLIAILGITSLYFILFHQYLLFQGYDFNDCKIAVHVYYDPDTWDYFSEKDCTNIVTELKQMKVRGTGTFLYPGMIGGDDRFKIVFNDETTVEFKLTGNYIVINKIGYRSDYKYLQVLREHAYEVYRKYYNYS